MSGPSVYLTLPPASLFKFPPENSPSALPPPSDERSWKSPFPISYEWYNRVLDVRVPLTIATCYIVSVAAINAYNRSTGNKPWWISKTRPFKLFVVLHNVFLAVYSAATFFAMARAILHTWPGIDHSNGLAGVADAFCKLHGPRGLGDAAIFNTSTTIWEIKNQLIHLAPEGTPDPTDVGRLWNEGLAFWGWWFYLSKFYEVLDTFIIVAKGKRSATLQTYHHAGAMMCMWAGIRYMSPPIWLFASINSFIHSLMYTYFTLSALNVKVPNAVKRSLTTLQILQFIFGASFAAAHLFVKYDVPISTPYTILHPLASIASVASSTASELAASATSALESPLATYGALLKRILLRAAGDEGVAENVRERHVGDIVTTSAIPSASEAAQRYREETRYRNDWHTVHCIDTTGQAFAVWLNLVYLAPLTGLFIRFFIRAYVYRKPTTKGHAIKGSSIDAAKGVNREIDEVGKAMEKGMQKIGEGIKEMEVPEDIKSDLKEVRQGTFNKARKVTERVQSFERKGKTQAEKAKEKAAELANDASPSRKKVSENVDYAKEKVAEGAEKTKNAGQAMKKKVEETWDEVSDQAKQKGQDVKEEAQEKGQQLKEDAQDKGKKAKGAAEEKGQQMKEEAKDTADDVEQDAKETGDKIKEEAQETGEKAKEQVEDTGDKAKGEVQDTHESVNDNTDEAKNADDSSKDSKDEARPESHHDNVVPEVSFADAMKKNLNKGADEAAEKAEAEADDRTEAEDDTLGSMVDVAKEREQEQEHEDPTLPQHMEG